MSVRKVTSLLTFSADCAVPKKIGIKANQMIQVVYMVNPIGFASLKVSGTLLVLIAYTVHVTIKRILYPREQMSDRSEMSHLRIPRAFSGSTVLCSP